MDTYSPTEIATWYSAILPPDWRNPPTLDEYTPILAELRRESAPLVTTITEPVIIPPAPAPKTTPHTLEIPPRRAYDGKPLTCRACGIRLTYSFLGSATDLNDSTETTLDTHHWQCATCPVAFDAYVKTNASGSYIKFSKNVTIERVIR